MDKKRKAAAHYDISGYLPFWDKLEQEQKNALLACPLKLIQTVKR